MFSFEKNFLILLFAFKRHKNETNIKKSVKKKTKTDKDIGKVYFNIEVKETKTNENNREIKTKKRTNRKRKKITKIMLIFF